MAAGELSSTRSINPNVARLTPLAIASVTIADSTGTAVRRSERIEVRTSSRSRSIMAACSHTRRALPVILYEFGRAGGSLEKMLRRDWS